MTDDQGNFELKVPLHESEQTRPPGPVSGSVFSSFGAVQQGGTAYFSAFFMARKPGYLPIENGEPGPQVELGSASEIIIPLMPKVLITVYINLPTNVSPTKIH